MTEQGENDPVGSVTEEAAKLLGALQGWATQGHHVAGAANARTAGAARAMHDLNEHIATGGEDCHYCPLCRVISAVRETSPEVRDHLATAATSLLHAAAGILETTAPTGGGGDRPGSGGHDPVERIDLSDDAGDVTWDED